MPRSSFASWLLMLLGLSLPTPLVGWLCSHGLLFLFPIRPPKEQGLLGTHIVAYIAGNVWSGVGDCLCTVAIFAYSAVLNRGSDFVTDHHDVYPHCQYTLLNVDSCLPMVYVLTFFPVSSLVWWLPLYRVHFLIAWAPTSFPTLVKAVRSNCKCGYKYEVIHYLAYR